MPRFARLPLYVTPALLCALALAACSGSRPQTSTQDSGTSSLGDACQFDSDCTPPGAPEAICSAEGTCVAGCATSGCSTGDACNTATGHCVAVGDAGTPDDAGSTGDAGTDGGSTITPDGGTTATDGGASSTLCQTCSTNSDCQDNGLCISDPTHTYDYCTQDCTSTVCPTGYLCTTDSTNSHHQCIPSGGSCPNAPVPDGGTTTTDGGTTGGGGGTDPGNPSTNGNGADQCAGCNVNNDCAEGAICVGSSQTGASDGVCELSCDPGNTVNLAGIPLSLDCVTQQCSADLFSFDLADASVDCLISYSVCGPVSGSSQNFCGPVLGCGSSSTLP